MLSPPRQGHALRNQPVQEFGGTPPGHALVVPRTCTANLFELPPADRRAVWNLVDEVVARLRQSLAPDGFNVGVNAGAAAGQTVPHAHAHVIPYRHGDVRDPRGGVRWVIPNRARYWPT